MRQPESQEQFDDEFSTDGLSAERVMKIIDQMAIDLRIRAAGQAKEWLLAHGYFNGELHTHVYCNSKTKICRVEIVVTCYGLPNCSEATP